MDSKSKDGSSSSGPSAALRAGQAIRRYFVTGLATLFPLAVTFWLLALIFKFADGLLGNRFGFRYPGVGLLVTILIIFLIGVFSVHFVGRVVFRRLEKWLNRLPLVRHIYPATKQLAKFLFSEESRHTAFRRAVLVQYPRPGSYSMAFVTNEAQTSATGTARTMLTLLIPQPPSPVTGPIIFVPQEDVIPLDITVEDAVKLIVSGGVVSSPLRAAQPVHAK